MTPTESKTAARGGAAQWRNPLRDKQDKRLPRIAGPCGMVIFGVTGDLARKKVMPAIYDLANRGLLPPTFSLVGFARRDWETQDFRKVVYQAVKDHCRTPFREENWERLAEGFRFVPGSFDDDKSFARLAENPGKARRRARHRRQPRLLPGHPAQVLSGGVRPAAQVRIGPPAGRQVEPGGHRETVRSRSGKRAGPEQGGQRRLPRGVGVPDRPLPGQGDGAQHPGAAVRQSVVRPDLERTLRRPRADHHGRRHRTGWAGRLLRRHRRRPRCHPEPSDAAAGADRDGRAGQLQPVGAADREDQGAVGNATGRAARRDHQPRPVHRGLAGRGEGRRAARRRGLLQGLQHRDVRRHHARGRHPPLGRCAVLSADR